MSPPPGLAPQSAKLAEEENKVKYDKATKNIDFQNTFNSENKSNSWTVIIYLNGFL